MKRIAVIFAGGVGARMNNSKTPKQFLEWNGRPILIQTLDVFEQTDLIDGIVLACKAEWIDHTKNLIKEGADVIAQHQDSSGPQEAAQEQGTYSIGYNTDMSRVAPRAHMTSAIWSWNPVYENVVEQVRAGTWKNGSFWYGMETGVVDIAPYGPMVPQNVRDLTEAAKADIKSGKLVVFTGPIKDQKGVERIPTGMVPSDKELLGMDWFVEGVIGTID